jgi:hypothetical protein
MTWRAYVRCGSHSRRYCHVRAVARYPQHNSGHYHVRRRVGCLSPSCARSANNRHNGRSSCVQPSVDRVTPDATFAARHALQSVNLRQPAPLHYASRAARQNDCLSENIQVVASHHRAFIQLPDFIQQHVFRVWNCDAAAGVGAMVKHQQSGVGSFCKLRQLFG